MEENVKNDILANTLIITKSRSNSINNNKAGVRVKISFIYCVVDCYGSLARS